jgi:dethiobiotin synthetase
VLVKGYFVTGTGTDVGKTYVTSMIARHLRTRGRKVFAFKPIETGCQLVDGVLVGADQAVLCEAAGGWQVGELAGVYRFSPAVAPAMAVAHRAEATAARGQNPGPDPGVEPLGPGPSLRGLASFGADNSTSPPKTRSTPTPNRTDEEISLEHIHHVFAKGAGQADVTLVEGAGGWRVPITTTHDMASLANALELPVVIVGLATLGTINHCLLSIEAVEKTQKVAWVVLSKRPTDDPELTRRNAIAIAERWTPHVLVLGDTSYDAESALSSRNVPRETLLDRFDELT